MPLSLQLLIVGWLGVVTAEAKGLIKPGLQFTDSISLIRQKINAETDSAYAEAMKALPVFELLPDSIKKQRDPVAKIKGKKVKFSQAMSKIRPVRPTGTWTDSIRYLQHKLSISAPFFMDTLLECLSYCRRTALKTGNETKSAEIVRGWSYEVWHQAFITDKNMGGNCSIYTAYMYAILREAAGVHKQVIISVGNEEGGHTFLIVRHNRTWYIVDPTYAGVWMMNNEPASLPLVLDSLRKDTEAPFRRFDYLTFNDQAYPSTIGVLMTKMELWIMWKDVKQPLEVYETNAYTTVPFDVNDVPAYFLAGIPYTGSQKLYEVRTTGNRMIPDGQGSAPFKDKNGDWHKLGFRPMFNIANQPVHFSSLIMLSKTPSLVGDQTLVKELEEFFRK